MTFKPYPWLTFFSLLAFIALITLGTWQVDRYKIRSQQATLLEEFSKIASVELNTLLGEGNLAKKKYRAVELTGRYLSEQQILMRGQYARSARTTIYGFYVFTPFEFITKSGTSTIMIDRGFIPQELLTQPELYNKRGLGTLTLKGHIKTAENQGSFLPDNQVNEEIWFWRDIPAMGKKFKLENMQNVYISLSQPPLQDFPKLTKIELKSATNNLSYLITWFSLALGLLILYIYMHIYNGRLYLNKDK